MDAVELPMIFKEVAPAAGRTVIVLILLEAAFLLATIGNVSPVEV
jgi:hypothetical protein